MVKLFICGFGNVGREFVRIIIEKKEELSRLNHDIKVVGIMDSKGITFDENGFKEEDLLSLINIERGAVSKFKKGKSSESFEDAISITKPEIVVLATPSVYSPDSPGLKLSYIALRNGCHVITADKSPLALEFDMIMNEAKKRNLKVKYKATVMAGTPLIDLLSQINFYDVKTFEGILNSSTNYILTKVTTDLVQLDTALESAKALRILEPDPNLDLNGIDIVAKLVIISRTLGYKLEMKDVKVNSILSEKRKIENIVKRKKIPKYIGLINFESKKAQVKVVGYSPDSLFAKVNYSMNAVRIKSPINDIILIGKGAGPTETAYALLNDVISIVR